MTVDRVMDALAALLCLAVAVWFMTVVGGNWPTVTRVVYAVGAAGFTLAFGVNFRSAFFGGRS